MNYFRGDKIVLIKECDALKTVGEAYEVASITDTQVVVRNVKTKVAVGAIDISVFDQYFKKPEEVKGWTQWERLLDQLGNTIAFYRTNFKKIQVRTPDDIRSEASCNKKYGEEFDLFRGIQLAYARCVNKGLMKRKEECESELKRIYTAITDNKDYIDKILKVLNKTNTENKEAE